MSVAAFASSCVLQSFPTLCTPPASTILLVMNESCNACCHERVASPAPELTHLCWLKNQLLVDIDIQAHYDVPHRLSDPCPAPSHPHPIPPHPISAQPSWCDATHSTLSHPTAPHLFLLHLTPLHPTSPPFIPLHPTAPHHFLVVDVSA